ncbi:dihydroorotate dehydrogenase electron transfer subunit [Psychrobacillus sp. INOP01]|uniref:dihydroorotate dehydrogenase electron transfer subunit n=1 Tax=Psychrobacillus sp. INOP01 TaxID=2829187 RepID=UPI001BA44551|nr:dihydroorotate dehydrogenase electron transfer subunit [Psychrobacillus sp. INOP01]QUG41025.1 dihydroorotate dehydrogenase electron transfer subunit [Psychrobacillus sp. INOP01]
MIRQEQMQVVQQRSIATNIFELTLTGQLVLDMKQPGQFVHLRVSDQMEPLLRRPISISSINKETSEFKMIYRAEGRGTVLLSEKKQGDQVDVLGPLGNGFPIDKVEAGQKALLVGGGIGVPPLYELSKILVEKGVQPIHVLGFQSEDVVFYEKQFQELGETHIVTADGSYGHTGFVTNVLETLKDDFEVYYSCGPTPMLSALEKLYPEREGYLSFEQRMGCGIGACFACVCDTTEKIDADYVKVCSDGPVFPSGVVRV